uniref:Saposin B-type domain-containing protein n=1 Tax=Parascaris equorum TaxID=6256 RepID=A0A914RSW6_PAREQ
MRHETIFNGPNTKERCVLTLSDLESKAWDRNGPLRDCSICRTFAAGAVKAVLSTPPDEQRCIRTEVTKAVAREAEHCLKKKLSNFAGVPDIPDLEEGSYQYRDNVVDGNARGTPAIGSGSKVDSCVANIKAQLITPVNDWVTVIDSALSSCIKNKPNGQNLGMDSLLNVGCRKLKSGFDFTNNLIDAMIDRSGRFCGGPHCPE